MKNKVTINIVGEFGCGKTIVADKIAYFLRSFGYEVNHSIDENYNMAQLSKNVFSGHISDTSIEIKEIKINRNTISVEDPLDETINKLNHSKAFIPQVLYLKKDDNMSNYRIIELFKSSIIVQETNIPDYYFIHKSRKSKCNVSVTTHELVDLLKENYELK